MLKYNTNINTHSRNNNNNNNSTTTTTNSNTMNTGGTITTTNSTRMNMNSTNQNYFLLISENGDNLGLKLENDLNAFYNSKTHYLKQMGKKDISFSTSNGSSNGSGNGNGTTLTTTTMSTHNSTNVMDKTNSTKNNAIDTPIVTALIVKIQPIIHVVEVKKKTRVSSNTKSNGTTAVKIKEKEIEINTSISDNDLNIKIRKMREWLGELKGSEKTTLILPLDKNTSVKALKTVQLKVTLTDKSNARKMANSNQSLPDLYKFIMDSVKECAPTGSKPLLKARKLTFTLNK